MNSLRYLLDRQARYIVAAVALLLATIAPTIAMAAQVTERSIELSSSSVSAPASTYKIKFTAVQSAGAFVVDFCTNTPLIGETCDAPAGMDADTVTSPTAGVTFGTNTASKLVVIKSIAVNDQVEVEVAGITNPSAEGPVYARILTYVDAAAAAAYVDGDTIGSPRDQGSVALYITPTISVSGAVLESMTFCVSLATPTANCGGTTTPTFELGEDNGGVLALSSAEVSEGSIWTQLSTNAVGGAIVNLKSGALNCGGLKLVGSTDVNNCFIAPALAGGIADGGGAKFGVKTTTATGVGVSDGVLQPFDFGGTPYYNDASFNMNALANNTVGVTSTYGDPLLDTAGGPLNNMNMELIFGAQAANNTPAGRYSADLSLIATGKF